MIAPMTSLSYSTWPPSAATLLAVRKDACAGEPSAPVKNWVYEAASIGFVIRGWFDYLSEGQATFAAPGAVIFGNAGEHFGVRHHDPSGNVRLVVSLPAALLEEAAHAHALPPRFHSPALRPGREATRIFGWMQMLARGCVDAEELQYALVAAALGAQPALKRQQLSPREQQTVSSALAHIEAHFDQPCSLESLAALTNMSRYHFLRVFSAVVGQTPNQYLINTRLRFAAERLATSPTEIAQVALDVGFNDISHFYACFRSAFSCTPRQWRMGISH
jgi:AraC-like DNA-binding protein